MTSLFVLKFVYTTSVTIVTVYFQNLFRRVLRLIAFVLAAISEVVLSVTVQLFLFSNESIHFHVGRDALINTQMYNDC